MQQKHLYLLFIFMVGFLFQVHATHNMGGEITWKCLGNNEYEFELIFYRDCNGFDVNVDNEKLAVWGHPNVDEITVNYIERIDISPICTAADGNNPFVCGSGPNDGNGEGAIEKVVYRSNPVTLSGVPPAEGWHFTFQNFSRSGSLVNLQNPTNYGITLAATMFPIPGDDGTKCRDNSPSFLQIPYNVVCKGEKYEYNSHAVDEDLDSLRFSFSKPMDYFPDGDYNPPINPAPVPFETGYSYNNPTPDASFDNQNEAASINPENGNITFESHTEGNFALKVQVDSYRNGVKIATIEREINIVVMDCEGNNTAPNIIPPFDNNTSYETSIYAGESIAFDIVAEDVENLQDGTPQSVTISSTGMMYGANFTDAFSGCGTPNCATLNKAAQTGNQGATMSFNWDTNCDHLIGPLGEAKDEIPYTFVFKIQDDYCPTPKVVYKTVTIHVKNQNVVPAPEITCIQADENNDLTIHWEPVTDPYGSFVEYEIIGENGGSYGTVNDISTSSMTINDVADTEDVFYISSRSGCNGETKKYSDQVANIYLEANNPDNGTAVLKWNKPQDPKPSSYYEYFYIYKEYPVGTWELIDSTHYNQTSYIDTITTCKDSINYQIRLNNGSCEFSSNISGSTFKDMIVPDIPIIYAVNIDTVTSETTISWNVNSHQDTYGYVVYQTNESGNVVEIDTVWGRTNSEYTYYINPENGPYQYSVAAFDSCYTDNTPPTFQTSGKADMHTTNFVSSHIHTCERMVEMNWTGYVGFDELLEYRIFRKVNQDDWEEIAQTTELFYTTDIVIGDEVLIAIQAVSQAGDMAFSNVDTVRFDGLQGPTFSYLKTATVENNEAMIVHDISNDGGVKKVELERYNPSAQEFEKIDEKSALGGGEIVFFDSDAEVNRRSYQYRTKMIDTCDQFIGYSNIGQTIYLSIATDETAETHTLQWNPYIDFLGNVKEYQVYRYFDGESSSLISVEPPEWRTLTDSVAELDEINGGKVCYYIVAREGGNPYDASEKSISNKACGVIEPMIFIPNAFTPEGKNPIFKPVTRNRQIDRYLFEIYDRSGRIVFKTTDPEEGWDGTNEKGSRILRTGVYVYRLSLRDGNGKEVVKLGHVSLLH